ncbi:hypothetical protein, partial [Psychrobacter sp. FME13]|uniref:hypothetical protein n=1 Tax=Psychrobacter sp. FME13 TaxID=2487708 RepID=UPI001CE48986
TLCFRLAIYLWFCVSPNNVNADWLVNTVEVERNDGVVLYAKNSSGTKYRRDEVYWDSKGEDLYVRGTNEKIGEDYNEFRFNEVTYTDEVATSDPSRIVSGKDLTIKGDNLLSEKSQINAGSGFELLGDKLENDIEDNGVFQGSCHHQAKLSGL